MDAAGPDIKIRTDADHGWSSGEAAMACV